MVDVKFHQAKTELSRPVKLSSEEEETVIAKAGKPVSSLVPYARKARPRQPGLLRGKIRIQKEFDAWLPEEVLCSFEGGGT